MPTAHEYAKDNADRFRSELHNLLRIPSVSTDSAYADDVKRAAQWLVDHLTGLGLDAEAIETERYPLVYAEWLGAGDAAKTVLIYGHYDVQPASKDDGWLTDPFDPTERDGKIYARGADDNKGQFFAHIKAVESLLKTDSLPVNVKFIIEGEEESGSRSITQFVAEQGERLKADVCLISDTSMIDADQPIIINALRGVAAFELTVSGPERDLHSGVYGGTVHNPALALAEIIAQLHDERGHVTIPGFYDNVRELSKEDRQMIAGTDWDNIQWAEETGAPLPWGEDNFTLAERVGARPTLEINGMFGGYTGSGMKAIIPAKATAKITCRLVPDQDPDTIAEKFKSRIKRLAPTTVQVDLKYLGGKPGVLVNTDTPEMKAAISAYEKGWGTAPTFKREGGSIPIVTDFQETLKLPVILMGFGLNTDGIHGPNEHFTIRMFHQGVDTSIHFLQDVAEV